MSKIFITFLCLVALLQGVKAQDANYWSSSYNPAGFLTPGAVIAFNRDSGVMFLNPALLAYSTKSSASISGSIYQYGNIKIKNGVGTGLNLKSTSASVIPQMISATITLKGKHPFTVGYALTHNPVMSYQATQQRDGRFNVLDDSYSPGNESFLGQFKRLNSINETSGIISGGFKVSDHFAAGVSAEGQLRKQSFNSDFSSRALYNTNSGGLSLPSIANAEESYLASYFHAGVRFKGGLSYDAGRSHVGLTISSPLLHVAGNANILSDIVANNIRFASDTLNVLANTRQEKLKATFKMPVSLGFGYAYDLKNGQIYLAAEYFNKMNEYNLITPRDESFIRGDIPDLATSSSLKFKDARKSVFNFGIGASYLLQPDVTGFLSLHTNFSYADNSLYKDSDGHASNTAYYNIYHCQVGANLKKRKFNFRTGLLLSYGATNKYKQYINFDDPNENNVLGGNPINTNASYFSVGLMLSYIHNL
ncbi:hypothetical protein [Mucilaginibacter pocheonensis]|uniref:Long-chain fatty acid transport protein n=1 Tax=Mucilaginibacter pocheonensis TaxID=398050 RepID=A0ABU1T7J1_9SPHI|nr:hypothetical protein [Mucilaginibacter pocheonensis]MDR6940800.1 hypothetical protein [Mucilaginibacter pocheonensis]